MAAFTPVGAVANPIYIEQADPYPWPFNGDFQPSNTCIIVIGMFQCLHLCIGVYWLPNTNRTRKDICMYYVLKNNFHLFSFSRIQQIIKNRYAS
jgi:hypothetical protein